MVKRLIITTFNALATPRPNFLWSMCKRGFLVHIGGLEVGGGQM